ncbi:unnamed protein product [Amoebophrya sp. A120]|nr:unnamed protein product [Amoebophrya sp. A120]|eukprot:GSA120T00003172001.1
MWVEVLVAIVIVVITATVVNWYLRTSEAKRTSWLSKELGVPDIYKWDEALIDRVEDAYFDALEEAEKHYCEVNKIGAEDELEKVWPSKLDKEWRHRIKMKLMERTMAWVHLYRLMEAELKRSQPLWRQNIISPSYWQSLKRAEEKLEKQFSLIKKEVAIIDPGSTNQTEIFRESCKIIDAYGYPPKVPEEKPKAEPPGIRNGKIIEKCSDKKTYELVQGPSDAELVVYMPKGTLAKEVRVRVQRKSIQIWRKGETIFHKELPDTATVRPDPTWQLAKKGDFEAGDVVLLSGLSKDDLNGQKGKVLKNNKETLAKGRIRVDLGTGNPLSIKPANLTNEEEFRKTGLVMSLEKEKQNTVWPMPPWNDGADEESALPQ